MRLVIYILIFPSLLMAQGVMDGTQLLQQEIDRYASMDLQSDPLKSPSFPLVEKMEFRTETHDFLAEEQEYTFRLSPSTFGKRKAQRNLYRHLSQKPDWQMEDFLCALSFDVQRDWLGFWYWKQQTAIIQERMIMLQQMDSIFSMDLIKIDADDIVSLRSESDEYRITLKELNAEMSAMKSFYEIEGMDPVFDKLQSPGSLIEALRHSPQSDKNQRMEKIAYDLAQNELELDLEKAENRQWLDFMQVRYQGPRSNPWEERLSIGIGFILPNSANRQLKVKELEIEAQELQRDTDVEEMQQKRDQQRWLSSILSEYEILQYKQDLYAQNKSELIELAENMIYLEEYQAYYEIQKRLFKEKRDLLRNRYKVYEEILEYYRKTELLCQEVKRSVLFSGE